MRVIYCASAGAIQQPRDLRERTWFDCVTRRALLYRDKYGRLSL